MSSGNDSTQWRGRSLAYWSKRAANMAGLRNVIGMYGNSNNSNEGTRKDLILRTMQVLDHYQPPLCDKDATAAIRFQREPVPGPQSYPAEQPLEAGPSTNPDGQSITTPAALTTLTSWKPSVEGGLASSEQLQLDPETTIGITYTNEQPTGGQAPNADTQSRLGNGSAENPGNISSNARPNGSSTSAHPSEVPNTVFGAGLEFQHNEVTKMPQDTASSSAADTATPSTSTAKAHAQSRNLNIQPSIKRSPDSPISVDDTSPVEAYVVVSQQSTSSNARADDLNRVLRRYLLQVTDDQLQPMEGYRSLLPFQNSAANKKIVEKKAFFSLFDDNNDPGIYSVQTAILQGQAPDKHAYQCARIGFPMPYRGRGPVWRQNSCHVDCCIVAARLMSVGQLRADVLKKSRPDELKDLTPFQECFRDMLALPWEKFTSKTNIRRRHEFLDQYYARRAELGKGGTKGSMHAANDSWQICAEGFGQFEYTVFLQTSCDKCSHVSPAPADPPLIGVLEFDAPNTAYWKGKERDNITELFRKHFDPKPFLKPSLHGCKQRGCEGQALRTRTIIGELPQRLVLPTPTIPPGKIGDSPIPKNRDIVGATSNLITVTYQTTTGQDIAHYRWLGGIYGRQRHLRLYWSDRDSGDGENLIFYDGMKLQGSVIGGVTPYEPHNAVPPPWSQGCDVLFYERIYPEKAHLNANAIRAKIDDILNQEQLPGQKRRHCEESEESSGSNKKVRNGGPRRRKGDNA